MNELLLLFFRLTLFAFENFCSKVDPFTRICIMWRGAKSQLHSKLSVRRSDCKPCLCLWRMGSDHYLWRGRSGVSLLPGGLCSWGGHGKAPGFFSCDGISGQLCSLTSSGCYVGCSLQLLFFWRSNLLQCRAQFLYSRDLLDLFTNWAGNRFKLVIFY